MICEAALNQIRPSIHFADYYCMCTLNPCRHTTDTLSLTIVLGKLTMPPITHPTLPFDDTLDEIGNGGQTLFQQSMLSISDLLIKEPPDMCPKKPQDSVEYRELIHTQETFYPRGCPIYLA